VLAMTGVIAAIDLADVTRSEVGRLWMPMMPLTLAAIGVAASSEKTESGEWLLTTSLLAITSLVLVLYWGT
jgi:hypothetical protein